MENVTRWNTKLPPSGSFLSLTFSDCYRCLYTFFQRNVEQTIRRPSANWHCPSSRCQRTRCEPSLFHATDPILPLARYRGENFASAVYEPRWFIDTWNSRGGLPIIRAEIEIPASSRSNRDYKFYEDRREEGTRRRRGGEDKRRSASRRFVDSLFFKWGRTALFARTSVTLAGEISRSLEGRLLV